MKEIDLNLETVEVKGGKSIPLTVRNVFYKGFWGKLMTRINWFLRGEMTFQEYLDSPVTYERALAEDIDTFHGIDAEAELTKILNEELNKQIASQGVIFYLRTPEKIVAETYEPVSREQWKMVRDLEPTKFSASYDGYVELKRQAHESMIEQRRNCSLELTSIYYSLHERDIEKTKNRLIEIQSADYFKEWVGEGTTEKVKEIIEYKES
jgi:hypothetical protein